MKIRGCFRFFLIMAEVGNIIGKITYPMTIMIRVVELMGGCF